MLFGTRRQVHIAGGNFARSYHDRFARTLDAAHDAGKLRVHLLECAEQVTEFVLRVNGELVFELSFGDALRDIQCRSERNHDRLQQIHGCRDGDDQTEHDCADGDPQQHVERVHALIRGLLDLGRVDIDVLIDGIGQRVAHVAHFVEGRIAGVERTAVDSGEDGVDLRFEVGGLCGDLIGDLAFVISGDLARVVVGPRGVEFFLQFANLRDCLFLFVLVVHGHQTAQHQANLQRIGLRGSEVFDRHGAARVHGVHVGTHGREPTNAHQTDSDHQDNARAERENDLEPDGVGQLVHAGIPVRMV